MGQILSYNHNDNKKLIVAFFGKYKDQDKVIELFHSNCIDIWILHDTPHSVSIEEIPSGLSSVPRILRKYFEVGDKNDYVKKCDMRKILKDNGLHVPIKDIPDIVKRVFPTVQYLHDSSRKGERMSRKSHQVD
jgi:hypothetical protein